MSIDDRCWQCRYGKKTACGYYIRCSRFRHTILGEDCDYQRQSRSKKDCGPDGKFFVHRDMHKLEEV